MVEPSRSLFRKLTAGLRPPPLDYEGPGKGGPTDEGPAGPPAEGVDVVVPVHGGGAVVDECFASLLRHTDLGSHRLVVVVDGDPAFEAGETCAQLRAEGEERVLLVSQENRGFVAAANRGMAASERDVVLLNSDTVLTRGWLEKLRAAAYSAPEVATATPFSNDATLCSLPRPFVANALPAGFDVDRFAELVERVSERRYPRLPTGVGMCLYLKRRALDRLGLFDLERFGAGYGEETDFCFRALEAGFRHVLDDATFVFHHGQSSFGAERAGRVLRAERELRRRHPAYVATIAHFLREDPARPARERVLSALEPSPKPRPERPPRRVLHLVHGWPPWSRGGSELYAWWLVGYQRRRREVAVYGRLGEPKRASGEVVERLEEGVRVRLAVNNFDQRDPLVRNALRNRALERDLAAFLAETRPELIHVHHLVGHAAGVMRVAAACGVPIVYQVQDWWPLCARVNLLRPDRSLCPGPSPARCSPCWPLTRVPPAPLWNRLLYRLRRRLMAGALARAQVYVCGSRFIAESYRRSGILPAGADLRVLPYGVEKPEQAPEPRRPSLPLRFGYVGTLMPHKGVHVAAEAFAGIDRARATLDLWGNPSADPDYAREVDRFVRSGSVRRRGSFREAEKSTVYAGLDALVVPSLGLESYGLVAREAMAHGVPVLASRRGALEEIFDEGEEGAGGACFEAGDVAGLRRLVERLADEPEILARWMSGRRPVVGTEEHAEAIEEVYAELFAGAERSGR